MIITTHKLEEQADARALAGRLRAAAGPAVDVTTEARSIIDRVIRDGDKAISELTEQYDGAKIEPGSFEVTKEEIRGSLAAMDDGPRAALELAASRIKAFASRGLETDWALEAGPGITVGQVSRPVSPVGIYVPGGRYPYASTVLMTGIPARVAGVEDLIFCVPPGKDGMPAAVTLAACAIVGDCRVFKTGGAQAIAAMAYGTDSIPACRMIAGPGNSFVAAAKRLVSRDVTVDLDAGPSEIVIYASDPGDAPFASCDLLAQLEHDPVALAVLVTDSADVLDAVSGSLLKERQAEGTVALVTCDSRDSCIGLINAIAAEHVEIMAEDAASLLPFIMNAGAVFLGRYSAVAFGDYLAGPSHVLPTGGTASRLSGLRAADFIRPMNVIAYTRQGAEADAASAEIMASMEGLQKHALSIRLRADRTGTEV